MEAALAEARLGLDNMRRLHQASEVCPQPAILLDLAVPLQQHSQRSNGAETVSIL